MPPAGKIPRTARTAVRNSLENSINRLERGLPLVLSGPSGAGKGTVLAEFRRRHPSFEVSVSTTTRAPRDGERDGLHYNFVSASEFDRLSEEDAFLEWAHVHGGRYGTLRKPVEAALRDGRSMFLEIDIQGGMSVKDRLPETVLVFVLPSDPQVWIERLRARGTETEETLRRRLEAASHEIRVGMERYDYLVLNDDLETAVDELEDVVRGEMRRPLRVGGTVLNRYEQLLGNDEV